MAVYKANALVLRRIPLGETDKIITLFTREYGKFSAVAKGSRRPTSRLAGAAEPLMFLRALLAEGMNLDVLTQCEVRESFPLIRGNFGLYLRATYACELLDRLTTERDAAPDAFDLLLSTLYILQRAADPDVALHAYELQLMALVGYEPRLDVCSRCETLLTEAYPPTAYASARGGALCAVCMNQTREDTRPLTFASLHAMRELLAEDDVRTLASATLPPGIAQEMAVALRAHLRYRLERDVRSTEFLDAYRVGAFDLELAPTGIAKP